ncbi:MAG: substrate-binding domain-containing protein [Phototrophicaceae bacterium]
MKRTTAILLTLVFSLVLGLGLVSAQDDHTLLLATTTSTQDSGLLDAILPDFEETYHATVEVVAVGTGEAIALGESGDADVLLVHSRNAELEFVASGNGLIRYDVMFNDFVIVGSSEDPAGIRGMTDATAALQQIMDAGATFVSRGDNSGTHNKELALWNALSITPEGDWYVSAGQGMGAVLGMSEELGGYTLTDRGTYLKRQMEGLTLEILVEGDTKFFNPYSVIPVNPEVHADINAELGQAFAHWMISLETQELINAYTVNEQPLFFASSVPYRVAHAHAE